MKKWILLPKKALWLPYNSTYCGCIALGTLNSYGDLDFVVERYDSEGLRSMDVEDDGQECLYMEHRRL
jgi:hypothetical protein